MGTFSGSLLDAPQGIIVHGCNAQGVMGSGVAKDIRDRWPHVFDGYRQAYEKHGLPLGSIVWVKARHDPLLMVANAITQQYYGRQAGRVYVDYQAVETAFVHIGHKARQHGLAVHYPMIGAGLGGGDWTRIQAIIDKALEGVEHHLWVPPAPANKPGPR